MTTISSRAFNQDTAGAKRAARAGPVFITDRGQPKHVLMTVEDYRRITGQTPSLATMLAADDDIDFDPPKMGPVGLKIPDFDG